MEKQILLVYLIFFTKYIDKEEEKPHLKHNYLQTRKKHEESIIFVIVVGFVHF